MLQRQAWGGASLNVNGDFVRCEHGKTLDGMLQVSDGCEISLLEHGVDAPGILSRVDSCVFIAARFHQLVSWWFCI